MWGTPAGCRRAASAAGALPCPPQHCACSAHPRLPGMPDALGLLVVRVGTRCCAMPKTLQYAHGRARNRDVGTLAHCVLHAGAFKAEPGG